MPAANSPAPLLPVATSFCTVLAQANGLVDQGFQEWSWPAGMRFAAERTWWGDEEARPRPHEGLDVARFVGTKGRLLSLGAGARVPVLFSGQVVAIFADFLGQSIMVAHQCDCEEGRLHSIYAHVVAEPGVAPGCRCHEYEIIARIAPTPRAGVPAHLHLSTLWLSGPLPEKIDWPWISASTAVRLCDPMAFINGQTATRCQNSHAG